MTDSEELYRKYKIELTPPVEFGFPFPPYDIQKEFMHNLYECIENKKLGIFESPTGTGKSLSIICGTLAWLRDHLEREKSELTNALNSMPKSSESTGTDWLTSQINDRKVQAVRTEIQLKIDQIHHKENKINEIRKSANKKKTTVKKKNSIDGEKENIIDSKEIKEDETPEEEFDEFEMILKEIDDKLENQEESDEEDEQKYHDVQIIFCSRTHSQLSQFVNEIKRTTYNDSIRLVPLASRQNYCINKAVKKLNSISLINEKCLELVQDSKITKNEKCGSKKLKKSKINSGCPMMKSINNFSDEIITEVQDVEEIVNKGVSLGSCPYYATRAAIDNSQLIVLPYNTLLHKSTREACGVRIDGNVVIIDEAHNLLETISHIHSAEVTGQQLTYAYSQLSQYKEKYEKRFSAKNLLYIKQLLYVIGNIIKFIGGKPGCGPNEATSKVIDSKLTTISEFITSADIDNFNLYNLLKFIKDSGIMQKLHSFSEKYTSPVKTVTKTPAQSSIKAFLQEMKNKKNQTAADASTIEKVQSPKEEITTGQPMISIVSILECLTNHNEDGRVIWSTQNTIGKASVKYVLLNPAPMFENIIKRARSVILCGGTMQPISEFRDQLFLNCGATEDRITHFACGHVIPPENILPIALCAGPTGKQLDFSFQSRGTHIILNELGRILTNICNAVPAGIVCFFPSYEYENTVYEHLEKHGVINTISNKKKIFREPKKSNQIEAILTEYGKIIKNTKNNTDNGKINGAILFSVVGGKLSEGLNFSDDLGRCVIVVGMPYPNIKSLELQEKMNYLNTSVGNNAGKVHYENLCMKAVNQSIGRAVRHRNDYATVLLLDKRYAKDTVQEQLPSWIKRSMQIHEKFGPSLNQLVKFFKSKISIE